MRKWLYCILMLFLSLTLSQTQAQNYPVQATPLLQPPYSLDLNDYQGPASKLRVQLLLRDLTKPSLEVYISLRLSGFGVELQTNPSVAALNTFVLQPGVPLTISGSELSPLFAQMLAQGVDFDDLLAGASLPGGYYTWEVVAYLPDGRQVSNTGRANMSVFKAQPPQITFPAHQATVPATGISTIPFQWISRSLSPASVLGTIYDMKIYELPDEVTDRDDGPPNVAVLSGLLPVFNTQTASTSYFYGPGDPLLQAGKRYAIVVQAQDIGGGDSYENQGLSQVVAFKVAGEPDPTAQAACPTPTGLNIRQDDAQTLEVSWNPVAEATDYLLQFRKANEPWQSQTTTDNGLMLIQLSPAKYEVQVATRCNGGLVSNVSPMVNYEIGIAPKDSTEDEIEDVLTYYNEDPETPEPEEYEEPEEEDGLDILNTPFTLLIDTDALPDSLKANLPPGGTLPTLPENPTIEQLKDAVKARKTICAAVIAGYTCGNHDAASPPSGDDYQPQPGDELAMNSIKIEVVEIDAAGNGLGIAHIKGFNNAKLGVEFKGIKVKEGGCIYAGQAITNSVDLALLTDKQKVALAQAYAIYNKVLDKIEENADGVAETINGFLDGLQKAKQKAQALNAKIAAGQTPTEAEVKTLAKLEDQNLKTMTAAIDQLKKKYKDDINTEALALMEGYMADKRAAATALANYKPSMGPPPAAIFQATANSQPELIDKTMKSVGPLMIAYNGKEYPIKKEKTINVVASKNSVTIKNLSEGEAYTWTLSDGTTGSTNPIAITFPDGKNELTLEVTQGSRKTNVTLKKKVLTYTDLVAIDKSHTGRKALASKGETLYLVRSPNTTRTINYQMTTTGVKGDFDNSEPLWSTTLPKNGLYEGEVLNSTGSVAGETRHSSPAKGKVFSTAVGKMLDVKVEVVDLDYKKTSYISKLGPLLQIFDDFNYVTNKLEKFGLPCKATFLSKGSDWKNRPTDFDLSLAAYNEEIKNSRLAEHREDYTLKMSRLKLFEFKCSKAIGWGSFSLGDFYASLSMTPEASITVRNSTNIESKANKWSGFGSIALPLKTEVGLEKKPNGIFDYNISVPIIAGAKGVYPYKGDVKTVGFFLYMDRTVLNISANVDVGIFGEKNIKLSYVLFDTKWEGDPATINLINLIK